MDRCVTVVTFVVWPCIDICKRAYSTCIHTWLYVGADITYVPRHQPHREPTPSSEAKDAGVAKSSLSPPSIRGESKRDVTSLKLLDEMRRTDWFVLFISFTLPRLILLAGKIWRFFRSRSRFFFVFGASWTSCLCLSMAENRLNSRCFKRIFQLLLMKTASQLFQSRQHFHLGISLSSFSFYVFMFYLRNWNWLFLTGTRDSQLENCLRNFFRYNWTICPLISHSRFQWKFRKVRQTKLISGNLPRCFQKCYFLISYRKDRVTRRHFIRIYSPPCISNHNVILIRDQLNDIRPPTQKHKHEKFDTVTCVGSAIINNRVINPTKRYERDVNNVEEFTL